MRPDCRSEVAPEADQPGAVRWCWRAVAPGTYSASEPRPRAGGTAEDPVAVVVGRMAGNRWTPCRFPRTGPIRPAISAETARHSVAARKRQDRSDPSHRLRLALDTRRSPLESSLSTQVRPCATVVVASAPVEPKWLIGNEDLHGHTALSDGQVRLSAQARIGVQAGSDQIHEEQIEDHHRECDHIDHCCPVAPPAGRSP